MAGKGRTRAGRGLIAVALVGLVVLAAAGCGDDSGDGTSTSGGTVASGSTDNSAAEAEIQSVIERAYTSARPADCETLYTVAALEQTSPSGATGEAAVMECKDYPNPEGVAKAVAVSRISLAGATATAVAEPEGGTFAGTAITLELQDDGGWKIDGLQDAEIVDRAVQQQNIDDEIDQLLGPAATDADTECIAEGTRQIPDEVLVDKLLTGDAGAAAEVLRDCLGAGIDIAAILKITEGQLAGIGVPKPGIECVLNEITLELEGLTVEDLAGNTEGKQAYEDAVLAGLESCGQ